MAESGSSTGVYKWIAASLFSALLVIGGAFCASIKAAPREDLDKLCERTGSLEDRVRKIELGYAEDMATVKTELIGIKDALGKVNEKLDRMGGK